MLMSFDCKCGKRFLVHEQHAGKPGICPGCKRTFVFPLQEPLRANGSFVPTALPDASTRKSRTATRLRSRIRLVRSGKTPSS